MNAPILTTARLILRPPLQEDFGGFAEMCAEEETMRFIGGLMPRDQAWRSMAALAGSWALLGYGMFSVLRRDTGEWIGRLGPWRPGGKEGGWPGDEVGWGLKRAAMGQGFAYEGAAARLIVDPRLHLPRPSALCAAHKGIIQHEEVRHRRLGARRRFHGARAADADARLRASQQSARHASSGRADQRRAAAHDRTAASRRA